MPPIGSMQWIRLQQRKFEEDDEQHQPSPIKYYKSEHNVIPSSTIEDHYSHQSHNHPLHHHKSITDSPVAVPRKITGLLNEHQQEQQQHVQKNFIHSSGISLKDLSSVFSIPTSTLKKYNPALENVESSEDIPSHYSVILGPPTTAAKNRIKSVMMIVVPSRVSRYDTPTSLATLGEEYSCSTRLLKKLNPELVSSSTENNNKEVPNPFLAALQRRGITEDEIDAIPIPERTKIRVPMLISANDDDKDDEDQNEEEVLVDEENTAADAEEEDEHEENATTSKRITLLALAHVIGVRVDDLRRANSCLTLMNGNETIPSELYPLTAPASCYATEHERFWRERVSNSLSPPRHKQAQYQLRVKEQQRKQEHELFLQKRAKSPGMSISVHTPRGLGSSKNDEEEEDFQLVDVSPVLNRRRKTPTATTTTRARDTIFSSSNPNSACGSLSPTRSSNVGKKHSQGPMVGFPYWKE